MALSTSWADISTDSDVAVCSSISESCGLFALPTVVDITWLDANSRSEFTSAFILCMTDCGVRECGDIECRFRWCSSLMLSLCEMGNAPIFFPIIARLTTDKGSP